MDQSVDDAVLQEIKRLYGVAEQRIKILEGRPKSGLGIPAVNQLRYAGYHLVKYVVDRGRADLGKAKGHCERAIYDSYELELGFYIDDFKEFCDSFDDLTIADTVPDFLSWVKTHQEAQRVIRDYRQIDGRWQYYEQLEPHIQQLNEIEQHLPFAREQLAKKRQEKERQDRRARMAVALTVVTLSIACFFWLFPDQGRELGASMREKLFPSQTPPALPAPAQAQ